MFELNCGSWPGGLYILMCKSISHVFDLVEFGMDSDEAMGGLLRCHGTSLAKSLLWWKSTNYTFWPGHLRSMDHSGLMRYADLSPARLYLASYYQHNLISVDKRFFIESK